MLPTIVHFTNEDTPFVNTTIDWAIKGLPYVENDCDCKCHTNPFIMHCEPCCNPRCVLSYTYDDLKNNKVKYYEDEVILFLEAGQTQEKHSRWTLKRFKQNFPNSKIVLFASDSIYYEVNNLGWQFGDEIVPDLIFEVMPQCVESFRSFGLNAECIPWTISRRLYSHLKNLATPIDFNRKKNDFIGLYHPGTLHSDYRARMVNYIKRAEFKFIQGGGGDHQGNDLYLVFNNFLDSWFTLGTTSHARPELTQLGCMKGFRDAVGIALNCLLINDDHPNVQKVWDMGSALPQYKYGDFEEILNIYDYYKDSGEYLIKLKQQQKWLSEHLLDDLFFKYMKKYNIL